MQIFSIIPQRLDTAAPNVVFAGLTITGNSVFGLNSSVFQPATDSTTFFQVLDADGGTPILNIDTTNERVSIGIAVGTGKFEVGGLIKFDDTNFNALLGTSAFGGLPGGITQAQNEGTYNIGIGYKAGYNNDDSGGGSAGAKNIYIGRNAGFGATVATPNTGYQNVGLGDSALVFNTSGQQNMAIGASAMSGNTSGQQNVGIGVNALAKNTTGRYNMGLGYNALNANTTGRGNVGIGRQAFLNNRTGYSNIAIGQNAGVGVNVSSDVENNVFIGDSAGFSILTGGDDNIFIGFKAGYNQTTNDNLLIIDNQDRGSAAAELTNCLMYGIFDATVTTQSLRFNVGDLTLASGTPYQTLWNTTHEDSDGGRESRLNFKGEQSGGELTTLARIEVGHDGSADDEKGYRDWFVNAGSDGDSPTFAMRLNSIGLGIGTASPTAALQMGDDKLIAVDVNAGLTASTTQEQGQGALTAQVNEISTVANDGDTITLPSAVTGIEIEIINNGAKTLQIFPASGDDLGLGVDTAEELEANERVKFVAYDTTNWAKESTTEIIHAEIHDEDNTDAFVINDAGGDFHSYHTNGLAAGDLANWTFDAGGAGTSFPIVSIADGADSGVDIAVTTTGLHGLEVGDIISQTNLANAAYVGIFEVKAIISTTIYEVAAIYTATGTGTMEQAATLEADAVAAGVYDFAYYISGTLVGNNETFDFQLYKGTTAVTGSKIRRKFGAANDFGSMSGGGVTSVANGDKISIALSNEDSAANIILRNLTIVLVRL